MSITSKTRTMSFHLAIVVLTLLGIAILISIGARAQDAPAATVESLAGRWLHDPQGNVIGSVRGSADAGRTARLMIGSYFQPGSHEIRVPTDTLFVSKGVVMLRSVPKASAELLSER